MQRKVIKVGTSAAVILPKEALREQDVRIGDLIDIEFVKKGMLTARQKKQEKIDPRVIEYAERCMDEYKDLLKMLADA